MEKIIAGADADARAVCSSALHFSSDHAMSDVLRVPTLRQALAGEEASRAREALKYPIGGDTCVYIAMFSSLLPVRHTYSSTSMFRHPNGNHTYPKIDSLEYSLAFRHNSYSYPLYTLLVPHWSISTSHIMPLIMTPCFSQCVFLIATFARLALPLSATHRRSASELDLRYQPRRL